MKVEIDIHSEIADLLIAKNLQETITDLKQDLKRRKKGVGIGIFSTNQEEDIAEIKRHIKAFKICLNYFGDPNEHI